MPVRSRQRGRSTTTRVETHKRLSVPTPCGRVSEEDPRQQGLKLSVGLGTSPGGTPVSEEDPRQQGLKHPAARDHDRSGPTGRQRGRSTTTRIETPGRSPAAGPFCLVSEEDPRQQGLKLPSGAPCGLLIPGQRGRSTTTRIETRST